MNNYISLCAKLNYQKDAYIYNSLDNYNAKTQKLILPCLIACTASSFTSAVTRTSAIAENILFILLKCASLPINQKLDQRTYQAIKEIPLNFKAVLMAPPYYLYSVVLSIFEPKAIIVELTEYGEIYREHIEKNSLHSESFFNDLKGIDGRTNMGLILWQEAKRKTNNYITTNDQIEKESRWVFKNLNKQRL